jgi:hypothetical protein
MLMKIYQGLLVILIIAGSYAVTFGFTARVVNIPDGDTVEVYKQGEQFKTPIDLYGIDCPEKQQYFGYASKWVFRRKRPVELPRKRPLFRCESGHHSGEKGQCQERVSGLVFLYCHGFGFLVKY